MMTLYSVLPLSNPIYFCAPHLATVPGPCGVAIYFESRARSSASSSAKKACTRSIQGPSPPSMYDRSTLMREVAASMRRGPKTRKSCVCGQPAVSGTHHETAEAGKGKACLEPRLVGRLEEELGGRELGGKVGGALANGGEALVFGRQLVRIAISARPQGGMEIM